MQAFKLMKYMKGSMSTKYFSLSIISIFTSLMYFGVVDAYAETDEKVESVISLKKEHAFELVIFNQKFLSADP